MNTELQLYHTGFFKITDSTSKAFNSVIFNSWSGIRDKAAAECYIDLESAFNTMEESAIDTMEPLMR